MNPKEQRVHVSRSNELSNRIDKLEEESAEAFDVAGETIRTVITSVEEVRELIISLTGRETTARNTSASQQLDYVNYENRVLRDAIDTVGDRLNNFVLLTFRARMRWLFLGK